MSIMLNDEKNLVDDLKVSSQGNLSEAHIKRVTQLVNEYKSRIESHLNMEQENNTSWAGRLADNIASFGGSWPFIIIFISFLLLWMCWNVVSFTAPVILMSQNRQAVRDKQESIMDFAINYKAEQENLEIQKILKKLDNRLHEIERKIDAQARHK
jgi:uncharacterized membrane protein